LKLQRVTRETPHELLIRLGGVSDEHITAYSRPGMTVQIDASGGVQDTLPLCSRPGHRPFEVLCERNTPLAERLTALPEGASVEVGLPRGGHFSLEGLEGQHLYLIGRGIGMAAVRAALLEAVARRGTFRSIRVFCEGLYPHEIPFREEIPAWQRAGVVVYQTLSRPDVGKWKNLGTTDADGESAYVYDFLKDTDPDPKRSTFFAAGPDDMVRGVVNTLRQLGAPPDRVHTFEHQARRCSHRAEPPRPANLLEKIATEGVWGSGHQDDAPDHGPVYRTPRRTPVAQGTPRYKQDHH
jgi:NAD(P)H-flavin reductase